MRLLGNVVWRRNNVVVAVVMVVAVVVVAREVSRVGKRRRLGMIKM